MSTYLDYSDRTVDLVIFSGSIPTSATPLSMALASPGESGQINTGILKLAQRFLLLLLTPLGSIPHLPLVGCDFMPQLEQGLLRSSLDVHAAFSAAVSDLQLQLQAEEEETDPDDERFASATILSLTLTVDSASLSLLISSRAGDSRKVVLPLSITV